MNNPCISVDLSVLVPLFLAIKHVNESRAAERHHASHIGALRAVQESRDRILQERRERWCVGEHPRLRASSTGYQWSVDSPREREQQMRRYFERSCKGPDLGPPLPPIVNSTRSAELERFYRGDGWKPRT